MSKIKSIKHPGKISLMNMEQVLGFLPISERTVHRYIANGKMRAYKMDGLLLFNPADIEAFLKRRSVGGGPAAPFNNIEVLQGNYRQMSNEEAVAWFAGVERDGDGTLLSNDEDDS
jgi:excisionase family DNA binding protein